MLSDAIKTSILVFIGILIVHVVLKTHLDTTPQSFRPRISAETFDDFLIPAELKRSSAAAREPEGEEVQDNKKNSKDGDRDLLRYVFGKEDDESKVEDVEDVSSSSSSSSSSKDEVEGKKKSDMKKKTEEFANSGSSEFAYIKKYDNESTMCGGKLFGGSLQGFDVAASAFQSL